MQKHILREKYCNYLKNVNFYRKIKDLLNRKRKKSLGEKKKGAIFFSWLEAFHNKVGELDKGWNILKLYEKSLQLAQREEESV